MDRLGDQLAELENAELVHRLPEDDLTYFFKHALTLESAYALLLMKKRLEIHRLVANAYEQLYPMHLDENAALLARHYRQAGDDDKTLEYAIRAGDAAARVFAHVEAEAHYAQALDALARLPDTTEHRKARVDTVVKQVSVSLRTVGPKETLRRLAEVEPLARAWAEAEGATREARLRLARVLYWQGHALIHQNDTRSAIQRMQQVLLTARAENDQKLLAIPASIIGRSLLARGQFAQAVSVLSDGLAAMEYAHDEHEWVLATGFRGIAMAMVGDYSAGIAEAERGLAHANETNALTGIAFANGALGITQHFGNEWAAGIAHARTTIETAARSGDRMYAYIAYGFIGWALTRAGNCRDAEQAFTEAHTIAQGIGGQLLFADWFAAARAEHALRCGQVERAQALAAEQIDQARTTKCVFVEGLAERVMGQALASIQPPRMDRAEEHLANSLAKLEEGSARLEAARTRVAWARVKEQRGDIPGARALLEQGATQFQISGLSSELEQTRQVIDSLSEKDK